MVRSRIIFLIYFLVCFAVVGKAQQDSIAPVTHSLTAQINDTSTYKSITQHPYLPLFANPLIMPIDYRERPAKEVLFYSLLGVLFLLAFIKVAFPKYFKNLFLLFFQTSLRQKQTREQLLQDSFASLLINILFIISGALFITLLVQYKQWSLVEFWLLLAYVAGVLTIIYLGKYLFIRFAGWVFNNTAAASGYLFLVMMVNRILGVLLIPLSVLLAFADNSLSTIIVTIAGGLVVLLFLYRYLVSFGSLKNDLQLNAFHFFLYLCAVEILPMVLIYKLLVNNIG